MFYGIAFNFARTFLVSWFKRAATHLRNSTVDGNQAGGLLNIQFLLWPGIIQFDSLESVELYD